MERIGRLLLCVLAAWAVVPAAAAGQDNRTGEEASAPASSGALAALKARLTALEQEEEALADMASRFASSQEVQARELWNAWLPPAVYLVEISEPLENLEMTEAAAEIAKRLLENRETETEQLLALKRKIERGETFDPAELDRAVSIGGDDRDRLLKEYEAEVKALRARLEALNFQKRFRHAADIGQPAGEKPLPKPGEEGHAARGAEKVLAKGPEKIPAEEAADLENESPGEAPASQSQGTAEAGSGSKAAGGPPIAVDLLALARTYFRSGRYQEAWDAYEQIDVATHPMGPMVLFMIGRCRERLDDLEGARRIYQQVTKVFPESFWAKEAKFAVEVVDWKRELGPIEGVPRELSRLIGWSNAGNQTGGSN
jgi:TolA-binding protein